MIGFVSSGFAVSSQASQAAKCAAAKQITNAPMRKPNATSVTMKSYNMEVVVGKTSYNIKVDESQTLLDAMEENGIEGVDSSCRAGVCMTCSAKMVKGKVDLGGAALADEAEREGYILTCSATPKSDLRIEMNQVDDAYEFQYGQYEKVVQNKDQSLFGKLFK